jgi:hypothetical protein
MPRKAPTPPALPNPAVIAERLALRITEMGRRRGEAAAERRAAERVFIERMAGMSLDQLQRHIPTKQFLLAVGVASGATLPELCALARLKHPSSALRASRHPVVAHLVDRIKAEQLQRALRGEFGVRTAARAAGPAILQNLLELGGVATPDAEGRRAGRAKRDADSIRAGEVVLGLGGYKLERHEHLHVHVLEQLTDGELEAYAETGTWPDRLAALGAPDAFTGSPPAGPTPVNGTPIRPEVLPAPRTARR